VVADNCELDGFEGSAFLTLLHAASTMRGGRLSRGHHACTVARNWPSQGQHPRTALNKGQISTGGTGSIKGTITGQTLKGYFSKYIPSGDAVSAVLLLYHPVRTPCVHIVIFTFRRQ
jgi:hypothetical protein